MRRIGEVAMSGAERTARWRQRRWEAQLASWVAQDIEQLPVWVDAEAARPIVWAWRRRGFRWGITTAQWGTRTPAELRDPSVVQMVLEAIVQAPAAPAPAATVWRSVMAKLQALRATVATAVKRVVAPPRVAQAQWREPHAAKAEQPDPPPPGGRGYQAFLDAGKALFKRPPCSCQCHRDIARPRCAGCIAQHPEARR